MADARYFIPDHALLKDVYSKDDLRDLLQAGRLSRSDIMVDDQTGLAHLLGDLLTSAYRERQPGALRPDTSLTDVIPQAHEFRADTPLPRPENERVPDEDEDDDYNLEAASDDDEVDQLETTGDLFAPREQKIEVSQPVEQQSEKLLYHGHPSWLAYPKSVLALFAFGTAAWLFYHLHAELAWVIISGALAVLPLLFVALDRSTTSYFITTHRVEMEFGMIGRSTKEVRISDIRAIDVEQDAFKAIVGIGNVKFDSSAGPNAEIEFINVRRPHNLRQAVRELQG
ncbi:MAG: PH domain-containing protein [Verrucomicrobia bacterium]|nr:PH domain-containing protein [Verrucomicrobiota bacterium]